MPPVCRYLLYTGGVLAAMPPVCRYLLYTGGVLAAMPHSKSAFSTILAYSVHIHLPPPRRSSLPPLLRAPRPPLPPPPPLSSSRLPWAMVRFRAQRSRLWFSQVLYGGGGKGRKSMQRVLVLGISIRMVQPLLTTLHALHQECLQTVLPASGPWLFLPHHGLARTLSPLWSLSNQYELVT